MSKLEKAKEIIKENWKEADCGIFDCRNLVGDPYAHTLVWGWSKSRYMLQILIF